jgi:hypothetical protein
MDSRSKESVCAGFGWWKAALLGSILLSLVSIIAGYQFQSLRYLLLLGELIMILAFFYGMALYLRKKIDVEALMFVLIIAFFASFVSFKICIDYFTLENKHRLTESQKSIYHGALLIELYKAENDNVPENIESLLKWYDSESPFAGFESKLIYETYAGKQDYSIGIYLSEDVACLYDSRYYKNGAYGQSYYKDSKIEPDSAGKL